MSVPWLWSPMDISCEYVAISSWRTYMYNSEAIKMVQISPVAIVKYGTAGTVYEARNMQLGDERTTLHTKHFWCLDWWSGGECGIQMSRLIVECPYFGRGTMLCNQTGYLQELGYTGVGLQFLTCSNQLEALHLAAHCNTRKSLPQSWAWHLLCWKFCVQYAQPFFDKSRRCA